MPWAGNGSRQMPALAEIKTSEIPRVRPWVGGGWEGGGGGQRS